MAQRESPTCRIPTPCEAAELEPLLAFLAQGEAPAESRVFPRGTLLPDGRLDLCKQDLGPHNLERITRALMGNHAVTSLLVGADFIGDAGAAHLGALLEANPALETLFVGCNGITAVGAERICRAAADHPRLEGLWLKRNRLGEAGARHVAELVRRSGSLRSLDLTQTELGSSGVRRVLAALCDNRGVERLYLCGNDLQLEDARLVAELLRSPCPIRELYLSANLLTDASCRVLVAALGRSQRVRILGLASNGLSELGAAVLAEALGSALPLQELDLGQSPAMGVRGAPPNRIGDRGAVALAAPLASNTSLRSLLLGGNGVGALGARAFVHALDHNTTLTGLSLGRSAPRPVKQELARLLARNAATAPSLELPRAIAAIRSVYRTQPGPARSAPAPVASVDAPTPPAAVVEAPAAPAPSVEVPISAQELETCVSVLSRLQRQPAAFFAKDTPYRGVRAAANRLIAALVEQAPKHKASQAKKPRSAEPVRLKPGAVLARGDQASSFSCYVCKQRAAGFAAERRFLCAECATLSRQRRQQSADLSGQVALVTGGRIKIGHEVALKLLRAGCRVYVTTRFPHDAARRFASAPDFERFAERLHIYAIDLRNLPDVSALARELEEDSSRLDVLVHNAALTVHRPPAYYAELIAAERAALESSPTGLASGRLLARLRAEARHPAEMTLVSPHPEADSTTLFPLGALDRDGQPLDLRAENSWSKTLESVSSAELLEVHLVSSFAPFVLTRDLLPLMRRGPAGTRHIVNVSAMEGSFSRPYKSAEHPHTNMAKASLNMLTRTLAESLAADRILVNSVDTGWITDERPHPLREAGRPFEPPLDIIDGAARVCDPIFRSALGEYVGFGQFFKDYRVVPW